MDHYHVASSARQRRGEPPVRHERGHRPPPADRGSERALAQRTESRGVPRAAARLERAAGLPTRHRRRASPPAAGSSKGEVPRPGQASGARAPWSLNTSASPTWGSGKPAREWAQRRAASSAGRGGGGAAGRPAIRIKCGVSVREMAKTRVTAGTRQGSPGERPSPERRSPVS